MTQPLDSRARVAAALDHREPDRVPRDLGATRVSGIHVDAYARLRDALGLGPREVVVADFSQRLARIDGDVAEALGLDIGGVEPRAASTYRREVVDDGAELHYVDEWGVGRRMPKDGFFFDPTSPPLAGEIDETDVARFAWPDPLDPGRFDGMLEQAQTIALEERRAVYVGSVCSGLTEMLFKLRGFEDGYMDLAGNQVVAQRLMEGVLEVKLSYWERALAILGDLVDVVGEGEDLGGQNGPLFSPRTYRELVKPMHAELFAFIRARTRARIFLHSCGAIRELIPDLIEIGVDVLNPVQVSAAGMNAAELKREFGRDLVFWGGGVDTQRVLGSGTPAQVAEDVRANVAALKSGGGFVFAAVHNIQANVPAENVVAMWRAGGEAGGYPG